MLHLDSEIKYVKGVGPQRAALLQRRGIRTVQDILFHFPRRYEDRSRFSSLDSLQPGRTATLIAKVHGVRFVRTRAKRGLLDVVLTDGTTFVHAKWFNGGYLYKKKVFNAGVRVVLTGKPDFDRYNNGLALFNPEFEILTEGEDALSSAVGGFVPIYEELSGITSNRVRLIVSAALDALTEPMHDPLPEELRGRHQLPEIDVAFRALHQPGLENDIDQLNKRRSLYHRRFIFEEFLLMELQMALRRHELRTSDGVRFKTNEKIRERLKKILPFHPTAAQKKSLKEIVEDLCSSFPMNRLLQGDVGSGKTLVAFEAIVIAVENGYQAVMMAPTEILAEQHCINARQVFEPLGYEIALMRKGVKKENPNVFEAVRSGEVQIVIGTHAVLEESTEFSRLGLVVIDEQHRFGVLQRLKLMEKGIRPNTLVMTATPIPRTLAMTFYGDLDISVIDEMPPGRIPITTVHLRERDRSRAQTTIRRELKAGHQCYVVYPLIEESEKLDLRSATEGYEQLARQFGPESVGLLHGRMKSEEKEQVMSDFGAGKFGILVSTTVVEVGVDVPNATLMVIEHSERFGLAQLHQLRGRVGRGADASECLLMTPNSFSELARERVRTVAATTDGFRLAEADLRFRGPGELAGTRQSGIPDFRVANLIDDMDVLVEARGEAERWVRDADKRDQLMQGLSRGGSLAGLVTVG